MANENGKLRVAAIGDLHVQENDTAPYREMFSEISNVADVLVLRGGRLYLGIHDEVLTDNSGAFRVTVYY